MYVLSLARHDMKFWENSPLPRNLERLPILHRSQKHTKPTMNIHSDTYTTNAHDTDKGRRKLRYVLRKWNTCFRDECEGISAHLHQQPHPHCSQLNYFSKYTHIYVYILCTCGASIIRLFDSSTHGNKTQNERGGERHTQRYRENETENEEGRETQRRVLLNPSDSLE